LISRNNNKRKGASKGEVNFFDTQLKKIMNRNKAVNFKFKYLACRMCEAFAALYQNLHSQNLTACREKNEKKKKAKTSKF